MNDPALLHRGLRLEYLTLSWNVGVGVVGIAAVAARSVALAGFGLDSTPPPAGGGRTRWPDL